MYIPGRLRTGSRPSRTVISDAPYEEDADFFAIIIDEQYQKRPQITSPYFPRKKPFLSKALLLHPKINQYRYPKRNPQEADCLIRSVWHYCYRIACISTLQYYPRGIKIQRPHFHFSKSNCSYNKQCS